MREDRLTHTHTNADADDVVCKKTQLKCRPFVSCGQFHQQFMSPFAPNLKCKHKKALRKTFVREKPLAKCW